MTIDPALVSRLVEATPSAEALPLLALTLAEMWNRRAAPELLTLDDYERPVTTTPFAGPGSAVGKGISPGLWALAAQRRQERGQL